MDDALQLGVDGLRRLYERRELSPVEVIDAVAARIDRVQPALNAFMARCLERAAAEAADAERRFAAGDARPLEGVPLAVKDLFDTEGVATTYGASIFADHVPGADAAAVGRAREAGAIVVAKTATHEFAWGITCENPHYGPCRNPWDPDRIAGGSSGGSAAALAAGAVPLALGTDTGGSIRIPAAYCGVVGLKPTYGSVDATGVFPLAPSLDHVGAMARSPADAWRLHEVIAAGVRRRADDLPEGRELEGVRIGLCPDLHGTEPAPAVERTLAETAAVTERLGATLAEVEFPAHDLVLPTFAATQGAEAHRTHRERGLYPERAAEYGADVRGRLERAAEIELGDYLEAAIARARIGAAFGQLFETVDLLLTPVSATAPVRIGETSVVHAGRKLELRALVMGATTPQDLAGLPACALRCGFDDAGLPVGLQITGPPGADGRVATAAEAIYAATREVQDRWPQPPG